MKRLSAAPAFAFALLVMPCVVTPASATGFFEALFGPAYRPAPPPPAPVFIPAQRPVYHPRASNIGKAAHPRAPVQKKIVSIAAKPGPVVKVHCCATVDEAMNAISHDRTLRHGDLVMTETGLKAFIGPAGSYHSPREFASIASSRNFSGDLHAASLTIFARSRSEGRSAFRTSTQAFGEIPPATIVDARGRTLRLVGGYYETVSADDGTAEEQITSASK